MLFLLKFGFLSIAVVGLTFFLFVKYCQIVLDYMTRQNQKDREP
jgi:hypothetical protein